MKLEQTHLFSAQKADTLDSKIRRLLQNPIIVLTPYIFKAILKKTNFKTENK